MVNTRATNVRQLRTRAVAKDVTSEDSGRRKRKTSFSVTVPSRRSGRSLGKSDSKEVVAQLLLPSESDNARSTRRTTRPTATLSRPQKRQSARIATKAKPVVVQEAPKRLSRSPSVQEEEASNQLEAAVSDDRAPSRRKAAPRSKRKRSDLEDRDYDSELAHDFAGQEHELEQRQLELEKLNQQLKAREGTLQARENKASETETAMGMWEHGLLEREQQLELKERNVQLREDELDEREIAIVTKEESSLPEIVRAEKIYKLLDERFTCALCFEIMASPYSLIPSHCGHSFCALCILKWFLSRLQDKCGHWHEVLECPLCRAALPVPTGHATREKLLFPFTPNRLANEALTALLEELFVLLASSDGDTEPATSPPTRKGKGKDRASSPKKRKVGHNLGEPLESWREGGTTRREWERRDKVGYRNMDLLASKWANISTHELLNLKRAIHA